MKILLCWDTNTTMQKRLSETFSRCVQRMLQGGEKDRDLTVYSLRMM